VEKYDGKSIDHFGDVAYADQVEAAAEQTEKEFGPIDVWVNNVSNSVFAPFKEITAEEFKRTLYFSVFLFSFCAIIH